MGFPCGSAGKESTCNAGDLGSIPGLERSPWRRERLPTAVLWLSHLPSFYSSSGLRSPSRSVSWTPDLQLSLFQNCWPPDPTELPKIPSACSQFTSYSLPAEQTDHQSAQAFYLGTVHSAILAVTATICQSSLMLRGRLASRPCQPLVHSLTWRFFHPPDSSSTCSFHHISHSVGSNSL